MKRLLLLSFIVILSGNFTEAQNSAPVNKPKYQADPGQVKWTVGNEDMPTHLQAFQECKGQFFNTTNNWKVLFGADYLGSYILLTDHGIVNILPEMVPMTEDDYKGDKMAKGRSEAEEEKAEKQNRKKVIYHVVTTEWENSNPSVTAEGVDQTPYYFGAIDPIHMGKGIDSIKGFKKIIYHDVYPGIDVVFSFHEGTGIEYEIHVKPGYDPSVFKMKYSGQQSLSIDQSGIIHMATPMGDILDHAPVSNQEGQGIGSSFYKISNNEIGFKLSGYSSSKSLVIDPWVVNPTALAYVPYDIGMDATDNVYVMGSAGVSGSSITMYVQKYSTAGALTWTYTLSQFASGFGYSQSDMTVDPNGNTYTPSSYEYSNSVGQQYAIVKLNSNGTLNYFYNNYPGTYTVFEIWNIAYSCDFATLVEAGSPAVYQEQVAIVNANNGNLSGYSSNNTDQLGEIYTGCIAPNGYYYCIGANPDFCPTIANADSLVCYQISGGTTKELWSANTGYSYDDYDYKGVLNIPTNHIGAGCGYIYTMDGQHLDQRSLTNGVSSKQVTIPNGTISVCNTAWTVGNTPANGGIAVDLTCGNVYVGTSGEVVVYDQNLNQITTQAVPDITFGVAYNAGLVAACGANVNGTSGFVTQFNAQHCPGLTITSTNGSCTTLGSATVSTPTFCTGPYTYSWAPGGQTTQTATGLASGLYTVTIGTASSCVTVSDTVTIVSVGGVNVTATPNGSTCTGGAVANVTSGNAPYSYNWSNGDTTSSITGVPAGTYTVNVTDAKGCIGQAVVVVTTTSGLSVAPTFKDVVCFGGKSGSATATATGGKAPYKYTWSSGQTTSTINGIGAETYSCTVNDAGGCSDMITVTITQPPQLRDSVLSMTNPSCFGDKNGSIMVGVKGGANPLSFSWNNGSSTLNDTAIGAGTYTLTVTDSNGCVSKINETLNQPTQVIASVPPQGMCSGVTVTLNGSATGGTGPYTYTWNGVNGGSNYSVSPATNTTYTLIAIDSHNCPSAPVPVTVTVNPTPNVLYVPDTIEGCYPLCVSFKDETTVAGGTVASWSWNFGNGTKDTSSLQNPKYCYTKPGVYTVSLSVVSNKGCKAQLVIPNLINVYDHPHADFTTSPQPANILQDSILSFIDKSVSKDSIISWFWTFGDPMNGASSLENPSFTYHDTGTYCPTLSVKDVHLCTDSVEHCLVIDPYYTLYIPNAFTPNGDGKNDVFLPKGIYVCNFEMFIFDRWGQQLFHTADITQGWNGKVNGSGSTCQEDTYVYYISASDCEHHSAHTYIGRVTIIK